MVRADRTYRNVEPDMWLSDDFRALSAPKPNAQTLWQYLLTGPRTTAIPGVVVARPAVMADDLRWSRRAFDRCLGEIVARGMAVADLEAGVVMLSKALIVDGGRVRNSARPTSPGTVKAWAAAVQRLPRCALSIEIESRCRAVMLSIGPGFVSLFAESILDPCTNAAPIHPASIADSISHYPPISIAGNREQRTENREQRERESPALVVVEPIQAPEPTGPVEPPGEIGKLIDFAVDQLNTARKKLDPESRPIGEYEDQTGREQLRQRLRSTGTDKRESDLKHALSVLVVEAHTSGDVSKLRLGMLGGPAAWPRLLAGTTKPARPRDPPRPPTPPPVRGPAPVVVDPKERAQAAMALKDAMKQLGISTGEEP